MMLNRLSFQHPPSARVDICHHTLIEGNFHVKVMVGFKFCDLDDEDWVREDMAKEIKTFV